MIILPGVAMRAIQNSTITAPDRICTIVCAYGSPSATPIPTRFNTIAIGTSTNSTTTESTMRANNHAQKPTYRTGGGETGALPGDIGPHLVGRRRWRGRGG